YAAGCTFEDSFAHQLQQEHRYPVKIMNWGYWGSVGVVAEESYSRTMERVGVGSIEPSEGMAALQDLMSCELGQMGVLKTKGEQRLISFRERLTYYPQGAGAGVRVPA